MTNRTAKVFDQLPPPPAAEAAPDPRLLDAAPPAGGGTGGEDGTPTAPMERCVTGDSSRQGPQDESPSPPGLGLPQNGNLAKIRPAGIRILRVLCDPESLELTVKEQIQRAQVAENTWYKYTRDLEFKQTCSDVMRDILLGFEPKLLAIALREAQNGSWKHFEWLSDRTGLAGVERMRS